MRRHFWKAVVIALLAATFVGTAYAQEDDPCLNVTAFRIIQALPQQIIGLRPTNISITVCNLDLAPDTLTKVRLVDQPCDIVGLDTNTITCTAAVTDSVNGVGDIVVGQTSSGGDLTESVQALGFEYLQPQVLKVAPYFAPIDVPVLVRIDINDIYGGIYMYDVYLAGQKVEVQQWVLSGRYVLVETPLLNETTTGDVTIVDPSVDPPYVVGRIPGAFMFTAPATEPGLTSIAPDFTQRKGGSIHIRGYRLDDAAAVTVNGLPCQNLRAQTNVSLTCDVPACGSSDCMGDGALLVLDAANNTLADGTFAIFEDMAISWLAPYSFLPVNLYATPFVLSVAHLITARRLFVEVAGMDVPDYTIDDEGNLVFPMPRCIPDNCAPPLSGQIVISNEWGQTLVSSGPGLTFEYVAAQPVPTVFVAEETSEPNAPLEVTGSYLASYGIASARLETPAGGLVSAVDVLSVSHRMVVLNYRCTDPNSPFPPPPAPTAAVSAGPASTSAAPLPACQTGQLSLSLNDKNGFAIARVPITIALNRAPLARIALTFSDVFAGVDPVAFAAAVLAKLDSVIGIDVSRVSTAVAATATGTTRVGLTVAPLEHNTIPTAIWIGKLIASQNSDGSPLRGALPTLTSVSAAEEWDRCDNGAYALDCGDNGKKKGTGPNVGAIIGGLVAAAVVLALVYFGYRRYQQRKGDSYRAGLLDEQAVN